MNKERKWMEEMRENPLARKNVLVGVLKSKDDRQILLKRRWYRIPVEFAPKRKFDYLAFYQPAVFGKKGKRIEYYARVSGRKVLKRIKLLPKEKDHPRARDDYLKIEMTGIRRLPRAIKNIIPRRIFFGFTSLKTLLSARDILELYHVPPLEVILAKRLRRLGIQAKPEFPVSAGGKRFRLDFAIFAPSGRIAVECDNYRAHAGRLQKSKDRLKDSHLRRAGWRVMRFTESDIIENLDFCIKRIQRAAGRPQK